MSGAVLPLLFFVFENWERRNHGLLVIFFTLNPEIMQRNLVDICSLNLVEFVR